MGITKTYVTIFLVAVLTISVLIQQYDRCIGACSRFYGNMQCYKNCRNLKYDGGQCDFVTKGEKLPECCCSFYKN
ncbi:putative defensin-like protein 62 [Arabidopsis lyrata subsp. lyrata]|uniref:putative defensin-like protein 62 n=1 Tax=Arabidopsis lyrata subsp. lyrata TaxID=81972 RepID=UPI000A29C578|nr:putative defensin-like protein 62 [Arabidopsis lyrata subsp. lyrata]|eukprot:XP_020886484.1 putative defensin-like protein 62 [Arabidopsis lyrata subsp. lyrata]